MKDSQKKLSVVDTGITVAKYVFIVYVFFVAAMVYKQFLNGGFEGFLVAVIMMSMFTSLFVTLAGFILGMIVAVAYNADKEDKHYADKEEEW